MEEVECIGHPYKPGDFISRRDNDSGEIAQYLVVSAKPNFFTAIRLDVVEGFSALWHHFLFDYSKKGN